MSRSSANPLQISCDRLTLTISRAPTAFWRASASVTAAADPPVTTQADRDRLSERKGERGEGVIYSDATEALTTVISGL